MSVVFSVLGGLCIIGSLILGWATISVSSGINPAALVLAIAPAISLLITGFVFAAVASGLSLLGQIERNTAYSADMLERLAGVDERKGKRTDKPVAW